MMSLQNPDSVDSKPALTDTASSASAPNPTPSFANVASLAPGDDDDDHDSAYGEEVSRYSTSVSSSVYEYVTRYGRTYSANKNGRWVLPVDDKELDRLDVHHHLILTAMVNKLYYAPLPSDFAGRALDLATGTGIWAIDFADTHPGAHVIGNDLAPTMPGWVPPNVQFYIDDIEETWTYSESEQFDFIHARFLSGAIQDWPKLMSQTFQHTKPGCYAEFQDWNTWLYSQDNSLPEDSALNKFHQIACWGRHNQGFNQKPGVHLEEWMKDAGFVDVEVRKILLPLGPWPKDKHLKHVGAINYVQMMKAFEAICYAVLPMLPEEAGGPWKYEEIQVFLAEIRKDASNKRIHGVYDFYVVWGRKPAVAS